MSFPKITDNITLVSYNRTKTLKEERPLPTFYSNDKMAASHTVISGTINVSGYMVDTLQELGRGGFGTVYRGYAMMLEM